MADKKNYYEILGVSKDATDEDIKAAYKKLVKEYHPDLHPNDKLAAEKFKEINEANEVLSDKQKRAAYDYEQAHPGMGGMGGNGFGGGFGGFGNMGGFGGFGDIFDSIFQGYGSGASVQRDVRGEDVQLTMNLSFMDAAKGCNKEVSYYRNEPCSFCHGTGARNGTAFTACTKCGGTGQIRYTQDTMFGRTVRVGVCPDCNGRGKVVTDKCPECKGKGYTRNQTKVTLTIPAGADTNSYMRKRGYGQASPTGGEAGDLVVVFRVEPHKFFQRKNLDLYLDLPVPFHTAALGGTIRVPDLNTTFEHTIPEGTQSGSTITIRGKGIKTRQGTGNLYLRIFVEVPTRLTKDQKKRIQSAGECVETRQFDKARRYSDNLNALYGADAYNVKK